MTTRRHEREAVCNPAIRSYGLAHGEHLVRVRVRVLGVGVGLGLGLGLGLGARASIRARARARVRVRVRVTWWTGSVCGSSSS